MKSKAATLSATTKQRIGQEIELLDLGTKVRLRRGMEKKGRQVEFWIISAEMQR